MEECKILKNHVFEDGSYTDGLGNLFDKNNEAIN